MPLRQTVRAAALLAAVIAIGACNDRDATDHPLPQETPVTARKAAAISFEQDPAYRGKGRFAALVAYDEPVALKVEPVEGEPRPKVPAEWKRKSPVVLELSCTVGSFTIDQPSAMRDVVAIHVHAADRGVRLATIAVVDCWSGKDYHSSFAHDLGHINETIERLRVACPAAVDQRLRDVPGEKLTIIGVDAQGRTVLVDEVDGYIGALEHGIRIGERVVVQDQHADFKPHEVGSLYWRSRASFVENEPIGIDRMFEPTIPDQAPKAKRVPAKLAAKVPLVLDIDYGSPLYGHEPALAQAEVVYVLGDYSRLLATLDPDDGWYTRTNWTPDGADGPYHAESLRLQVDPAVIASLRGADYASVTVVIVDRKGRTILSDLVSLPQP